LVPFEKRCESHPSTCVLGPMAKPCPTPHKHKHPPRPCWTA
jgi:hypothetical protein